MNPSSLSDAAVLWELGLPCLAEAEGGLLVNAANWLSVAGGGEYGGRVSATPVSPPPQEKARSILSLENGGQLGPTP